MLTIYKNPYQCRLETEIIRRRFDGSHSHLQLADSICFDYSGLNLPREDLEINEEKVSRIYFHDGRLIYVIPGKPDRSLVRLSLPFESRFLYQREISVRLLIRYILDLYFAIDKPGFRTEKTEDGLRSLLFIPGRFRPEDGPAILDRLKESLDRIIRAGLSIKTLEGDSGPETTVFGLTKLAWMGPHLFNSAEIYRLDFSDGRQEDEGLLIPYRLR